MAAAAGAGGGLTDAQRRVFTEVFEHVDANKDGFLVFEELKKAILAATELHGKKITERQAKEAAERALQDCDMNNDHRITLEEWLNFFSKVAHIMDDRGLDAFKKKFGVK